MKELVLHQTQDKEINEEVRMIVEKDYISIIDCENQNDQISYNDEIKYTSIMKDNIALIRYEANHNTQKKINAGLIGLGILIFLISIFPFVYELIGLGIALLIIGMILIIVGGLTTRRGHTTKMGNFKIINYQDEIIYSKNIILEQEQINEIITSIHQE